MSYDKLTGASPKIYDFERFGSYGRFTCGNSFPVDFFQTNFTPSELKTYLKLAREIQTEADTIDFDLLIQRDINDDRVRREIEPYLSPKKATESEIRSRAIFFPPILAAIVPTKNNKMQLYYPDELGIIDDKSDLVHREWPGLFKITNKINIHGYQISVKTPEGIKNIGVDLAPSILEFKMSKESEYGAKLVVIDGQHRLYALREIYDKNPELLDKLVLPVCILYSPQSTESMRDSLKPLSVPTVPEVFRHLFVDVNSTMELVGGHFNILLSDDNIGSLVCRKFCDSILKDPVIGINGLAVIEWNTKSRKESTFITRKYSLSSIGIIDLALKESIGTNKHLVKYVLNLAEVDSDLYPESDEYDFPKVEWDRFSLNQKGVLSKQVENLLIPCLKKLFFGTEAFKSAFNIFAQQVKGLEVLGKSDKKEAKEGRRALRQILEYVPIGQGKLYEDALSIYSDFESDIYDRRNKELNNIIRYALFQRAMFALWSSLLNLCRDYGIKIENVTDGTVALLNIALSKSSSYLIYDVSYMQYSVFDGINIKPKQDTRKPLTFLLRALLGNKENSRNVLAAMGLKVDDDYHNILLKKFIDDGQGAATEFISYFKKERKKIFKGSYRVSFTIPDDEKAELIKEEETQKQDLKLVREGDKTSSEVSTVFDEMVDKIIESEVMLAKADFIANLGYDVDIPTIENGDELENGD